MSIGLMQMDWDEYQQISGGNDGPCLAPVNNKGNKLWLNEEFSERRLKRSFQDVRDALKCFYAAGHISDKRFLINIRGVRVSQVCFPDSFQIEALNSSKCN